MAITFDLYCGNDDEEYVSLSELIATPDKFPGLILGLLGFEFLSIYVYEQNKINQNDEYIKMEFSSDYATIPSAGCFYFDTGMDTCEWFDFLVYSLENKGKTIVLQGPYNQEDVCCLPMDNGLLLVNPEIKAIPNFEDYRGLVECADFYKDSSGIMFNNVKVIVNAHGFIFDESKKFREDILSRSKNVALIDYDVWKEQTWKLICEYKKVVGFYKNKILIQLTESSIKGDLKELKTIEEKIIGYKKRLNK